MWGEINLTKIKIENPKRKIKDLGHFIRNELEHIQDQM